MTDLKGNTICKITIKNKYMKGIDKKKNKQYITQMIIEIRRYICICVLLIFLVRGVK